jgi:hypothetical protein
MFMPLPLAKAKNGKDYKVGKKTILAANEVRQHAPRGCVFFF